MVSATVMIAPRELEPSTLTVSLVFPFSLAARIWLAIRVRPSATVELAWVWCFSWAVRTVSVLSRTKARKAPLSDIVLIILSIATILA